MINQLKSALRCGAPIVSILSGDEPATVQTIAENIGNRPILQYDCVRGFVAVNPAGETPPFLK